VVEVVTPSLEQHKQTVVLVVVETVAVMARDLMALLI
jgi:hypothetical protein